jgi:hypothetical protein
VKENTKLLDNFCGYAILATELKGKTLGAGSDWLPGITF